jgi:hypothetical protein
LEQLQDPQREIATREVEIEGMGTVLVRGMSKGKARVMRAGAMRGGEIDADLLELEIFRNGVIEPLLEDLTNEAIEAMFGNWPQSDIDKILMAIMDLNGWTPEFVKGEAARFPDGP